MPNGISYGSQYEKPKPRREIGDLPVYRMPTSLSEPIGTVIWPVSARPPFQETVPGAGPGGPGLLQSLYSQIAGMAAPTRTTTAMTQQMEAPALEQAAGGFTDILNQLSENMRQAYQVKQQTYNDLVKSLSDMYRTQMAGMTSAAQSGALASGLTPLEAAGAGRGTALDVLQQYYPQLAGLRAQQADVGIGLQGALAGLQQGLGLPLLNMMAPYYQAVAGRRATETVTDPMAQVNALIQLAGGISGEQQTQAQMDLRRVLAEMGETGAMERLQLGEAEAMRRAQLGEAGALERTGMTTEAANLRNLLSAMAASQRQQAQQTYDWQKFFAGQELTRRRGIELENIRSENDWNNWVAQQEYWGLDFSWL